MHTVRLILGSASPRRRRILADLGVRFDVAVPDVEEVGSEVDPAWAAGENARLKSAWCRDRFPHCRLITADTVVVHEGRGLGKPASMDEATRWLLSFSGGAQRVLTGLVLFDPERGPEAEVVESIVHFREMDEDVVARYLAVVDPLDKAGGYDIDDHGDIIIQASEGSRTNIMGLPAERVRAWLDRLGIAPAERGR